MIALFTFQPSFCPSCGKRFEHSDYNAQDFTAYASFTCDCGLDYQRVNEGDALDAAEAAGGDLKRMRELDELHRPRGVIERRPGDLAW
jgi:hypothetical protein